MFIIITTIIVLLGWSEMAMQNAAIVFERRIHFPHLSPKNHEQWLLLLMKLCAFVENKKGRKREKKIEILFNFRGKVAKEKMKKIDYA